MVQSNDWRAVIRFPTAKKKQISLSDVIARGKRLEASAFDVEAKQAWQTVINNRFGIKHVQKQINDLALQANQKRYKAYKLEQQALDIMDNEVIFAK